MDATTSNNNNNIILKELVLLCNNCNTLEDNILEIGTVCFPDNNYKKDIIEMNKKFSTGIYIYIFNFNNIIFISV